MSPPREATVIVADVNDDAGQRVAVAVGGTYHHLDVTAPDQWRRALEQTVEGGRLDGLVNNAAVFIEGGLFDGDEAGFRTVTEVNLLGVLFGMAAVAPIMRDQGAGSIVNIASVSGRRGPRHDRLCRQQVGGARHDAVRSPTAGAVRCSGQRRASWRGQHRDVPVAQRRGSRPVHRSGFPWGDRATRARSRPP